MLNHCPRDYRAVLLQLENHVEREIHARSRRKIPMECDRINSGIKHAEIAVPGRMRDPRSRRRAVLIEQQRIARRSRGGGYGISGKKFRRSCRPRCTRGTRCARRTRGPCRTRYTRGTRRTRCACRTRHTRDARCARCASRSRRARGARDARNTRNARCARRACRTRNTCNARRTRRYGNLWEYMSLFRLSEVVEMFVADKFVIYMYVAGVCLTVLFSDSNKIYQLNTHLPRQRLTSSILF